MIKVVSVEMTERMTLCQLYDLPPSVGPPIILVIMQRVISMHMIEVEIPHNVTAQIRIRVTT